MGAGKIIGKGVGWLKGFFRPRSELYLFGSSVLWGQGHAKGDKIGYRTAKWIAERFGERVKVRLLAHSGAFLTGDPDRGGRRLHGEIPSPWPSLLQQIRKAPKARSSRVRILVEGGINEVGGGRISNPTTSPEFIASATEQACGGKMREVLGELSRRFPESEIYLIGYYQILADSARRGEVEEMMEQDWVPTGKMGRDDFDPRARAVENARQFRRLSDRYLRQAAEETGRTHPGYCVFVDSGFEAWEGMFGDPALVFNPWTKDPMRKTRARHCTLAIALRRTGLHCYLAATGHPNGEGVDRYVSRITAAMDSAAGQIRD